MKHIYVLTLFLFLTSCGSKMTLIATNKLVNTSPEIGIISNAEIGISLVFKESGYIYNALQINEDRKEKPGYFTYELKQGELFLNKYETKKYILYASPNHTNFGIAIPKEGGEQMLYVNDEMGLHIVKLNTPIKVSKTLATLKDKEYFKKEFIYVGKVGNAIKFIYREFINNNVQPALTQELQYDLSQSKIIGFRGLRLEVINANNTNIEYKVVSHFSN